jgi:hypothetical protein
MAGVEKLLGGFRIKTANELRGVLEVGKQHHHLLALTGQGSPRGQDLFAEVLGGVGQRRLVQSAGWGQGDQGRAARGSSPDQAAPRIVVHFWMGIEEFVL